MSTLLLIYLWGSTRIYYDKDPYIQQQVNVGDLLCGPANLRPMGVLVQLKERREVLDVALLSEEVLVGRVVLQEVQ